MCICGLHVPTHDGAGAVGSTRPLPMHTVPTGGEPLLEKKIKKKKKKSVSEVAPEGEADAGAAPLHADVYSA